MPDKIYAILNFTGIALGDTLTLAHELQIAGVPIKPDKVDLQFPGSFEVISGTTTELTLRNINSGTGDCEAWVFAIHPAIRLLGASPDDGNMVQGLTPRPFSAGTDAPGPPFPPALVTTTIYANTTGNDTTGTGSLAAPYRTAQRAFQDLPALSPVLPGHQVVVDVTDLDIEDFDVPGYQMPIVLASCQGLQFGDPATAPFLHGEAVCVRATPRAYSGIPVGDTHVLGTDIVSVTSNADTGLALVTTATPRASWAANALKGRMCIGGGTDANTSCIIYGSDSTHLRLCNTAANVTSIPQQDLFIVEPSAEFHSAGVGPDGAGIQCTGYTSVIFQGIKFTVDGGGSAFLISNCPQPFMELCDIDGLAGFAIPMQFGVTSSVIRSGIDIECSALTPKQSMLLGVTSIFYMCGAEQVFRQTVLDGCAAIGPSTFATTNGGLSANAWEFFDCLFTGGTEDGILARGGGSWSLENVRFDTAVGDAVHATGLTTGVLTHVTGAGNGGAGVHLEDGASFRVTDNATLVTGTAGDILVGTLPARTWTNFRTLIPTKNQYDLRTPFIANVASGLLTPGGDDVTGAGTGGCSGSRLFQRP